MIRTIRSRMKRESTPRILILGLDNAGKTTILRKLEGEDSAAAAPEGPTQGFNVKTLALGQGRQGKFCDLGGQRTLRDFWKDYYESTDCLMFVVDSSDQRRLDEAHETFKEVIDALPRVPILVLANKQDLATAKEHSVIAEVLELVECRDRRWEILPCSAKTGTGLEEGLSWIMTVCK